MLVTLPLFTAIAIFSLVFLPKFAAIRGRLRRGWISGVLLFSSFSSEMAPKLSGPSCWCGSWIGISSVNSKSNVSIVKRIWRLHPGQSHLRKKTVTPFSELARRLRTTQDFWNQLIHYCLFRSANDSLSNERGGDEIHSQDWIPSDWHKLSNGILTYVTYFNQNVYLSPILLPQLLQL